MSQVVLVRDFNYMEVIHCLLHLLLVFGSLRLFTLLDTVFLTVCCVTAGSLRY